ncbi:MAG TPA: DUF5724 domain-containing protein [Gemmataceae bacterium]|nr:DUF5724 domain-containing protein [Gemmataceae bacterium]
MLKPQQAREALKQFYHEDGEQRRLAALKPLPPRLAEIGRGLMGRDPEGNAIEEWEEESKVKRSACRQLDALSPPERSEVFEALFPKLGRYIEAGWQIHRRLPYQTDYYDRKAFRAPNNPAALLAARSDWVCSLLIQLEGYEEDITWLAAWAAHLGFRADAVGILLAAAIDTGGSEGETVFEILCDSARGTHEIGGMGRHVPRALLVAARPDGWEFVERLLLAAQRQEGLRQTILETIDEAHPEAFRRMLRLIREHNLTRFSATVRAVDTWFGFRWDSASARVVNQAIEHALKFLEDPNARARAIGKETGDALYLALWAQAFEDADAVIEPTVRLLNDTRAEQRFVGVHLLAQLKLPAARERLRTALDDEDLRVALYALEHCRDDGSEDEEADPGDLFERVERLLARVPEKEVNLKPLVWPWTGRRVDRKSVAGHLIIHLGKHPPTRLIPYLPLFDPWKRAYVVDRLAEMEKWDAAIRETLLALVGDKAGNVRESAVQALKKCPITPAEAERLEELLTRKAGDLRRGVLALLLNQTDDAALASAERLLTAGQLPLRLAGLDLLRQMAEAGRQGERCRARAERYRTERGRLSDEEEKQLTAILDTARPQARLDDALGLLKPEERTPPVPPRGNLKVAFRTPAAIACLESLDELVHEHRQTPVVIKYLPDPDDPEDQESESEPTPLGNLGYRFPSPNTDTPVEKDIVRLPLRELWERWWAERPRELRDPDGFELLRALACFEWEADDWREPRKRSPQLKQALEVLTGGLKPKELRYEEIVKGVLEWLLRLHPPEGAPDFLLDAVEASFALVPPQELEHVPDEDRWEDRDWRSYDSPFVLWLDQARSHRDSYPAVWRPEHHVRLWRLLRWKDEPGPKVPRNRPELNEIVAAYRAGGATEADLIDQLLGPHDDDYGGRFHELGTLTERKLPPKLAECPGLAAVVERCRQRVLEIELARGEAETPASGAALSLNSVEGIDILIRLLQALGKDSFVRGYLWNNQSRAAVFSHLIKVAYPGKDETEADFAAKVKAAGINQERLIQLAFHAPQWVKHVEQALGWPGFAEGVWWFIAHTRDSNRNEDEDKWKALLSERTALTPEELAEGAVDVAWFHRTYEALGAERWAALSAAAKFASTRQGYKRALFLAEVMRGKVAKKSLVSAIRQKRRREEVRALGLLPLAKGKAREADLLDRYQVYQDYLRYARKLGSMSRDSALRAAAIGMQNLARTAGYPDPIRLEWAMETRTSSDLADGPVTVTVKEVSVTLGIDHLGQPEITVRKKDKPLKNIPPAIKKHKKVAALLERKAELKRQSARVRRSLENMMCRGDPLTGAELQQLFGHPVLAPLLERLVLIGDGIIGYPTKRGKALRDHAGRLEPVTKDELLRIAHPYDLLRTKKWHLWQHDCFRRELVQPFKQVFRELYVLTEAEKADDTVSRRYAGQQVNPRQAVALWTSRGWAAGYGEGVSRTFHDADLSVHVSFLGGYFTPAEVEGLTIEGVYFTKRGEWKPLPLVKVPPRLFSEVMRDLDLVVSVAHRGGVDPEASASTVEMRSALLRETCALLKLDNVRVQGSHVLIDGELGNYSVHLGSAVVHRQPGGSLCLVPVHAQHRGRLFLPFADDDPKTAEVISKVILLARDSEIQDPTILDQLRASP